MATVTVQALHKNTLQLVMGRNAWCNLRKQTQRVQHDMLEHTK